MDQFRIIDASFLSSNQIKERILLMGKEISGNEKKKDLIKIYTSLIGNEENCYKIMDLLQEDYLDYKKTGESLKRKSEFDEIDSVGKISFVKDQDKKVTFVDLGREKSVKNSEEKSVKKHVFKNPYLDTNVNNNNLNINFENEIEKARKLFKINNNDFNMNNNNNNEEEKIEKNLTDMNTKNSTNTSHSNTFKAKYNYQNDADNDTLTVNYNDFPQVKTKIKEKNEVEKIKENENNVSDKKINEPSNNFSFANSLLNNNNFPRTIPSKNNDFNFTTRNNDSNNNEKNPNLPNDYTNFVPQNEPQIKYPDFNIGPIRPENIQKSGSLNNNNNNNENVGFYPNQFRRFSEIGNDSSKKRKDIQENGIGNDDNMPNNNNYINNNSDSNRKNKEINYPNFDQVNQNQFNQNIQQNPQFDNIQTQYPYIPKNANVSFDYTQNQNQKNQNMQMQQNQKRQSQNTIPQNQNQNQRRQSQNNIPQNQNQFNPQYPQIEIPQNQNQNQNQRRQSQISIQQNQNQFNPQYPQIEIPQNQNQNQRRQSQNNIPQNQNSNQSKTKRFEREQERIRESNLRNPHLNSFNNPNEQINDTNSKIDTDYKSMRNNLLIGSGIAFSCLGGYSLINRNLIDFSSIISQLNPININFSNQLPEISSEKIRNLFENLFGSIGSVFSQIANSSFQFIITNFSYIFCLFALFMLAIYIYRRITYYRIAREVYEKIRKDLKLMKQNNSDFEKGITIQEIVEEYSKLYNIPEETFRQNVLPIIIESRKNDMYVRFFIRYANGRNLETWQWR